MSAACPDPLIFLSRLRTLLSPHPPESSFTEAGWDDVLTGKTLTPAAVLFPLVLRDQRFTVLLTQRTAHLHDHAGQIAFPGGRVEANDVDAAATALRETEEEIGLSRDRVEILGFLPIYRTGTGFAITPVVAAVHPPFTLKKDDFEVDAVFEVPLDFLLNPENHKQHQIEYKGKTRHFYAMPYGEHFIWGATAGMIRQLYAALGASK